MSGGHRGLALLVGLRAAAIAGLFLVPLVPLVVVPWLYFPFVTGKAFAFRLLVEILLGVWIVLVAVDPRGQPCPFRLRALATPISVAGAAFIAILVLSTVFSQNPERSVWSTFERMEGLVGHLHLACYFVLLRSLMGDARRWFAYLNASIAVSVLVGLSALVWGGERLAGTLGAPTFLAAYMLVHAIATLWLWARFHRRRAAAHLYLLVALFQVGILYGTATRGALLGLVGGAGAAFLAASVHRGRRAVSRSVAVVAVTCAVLAGGFVVVQQTGPYHDSYVLTRFAQIPLRDEPRLVAWQLSVEGAREHLVLGWGMENFPLVFSRYYRPELGAPEQWYDRAHNGPLDWLVSAGVLGAIGYLSLFGAALYCIWRRSSSFGPLDQSALTGLVAAQLVANLFAFDTLGSYLFFVALLAYLDGEGRRTAVTAGERDGPGRLRVGVALAVAALVTVGAMHALNERPYRAARALGAASDPALGAERRLALFEEAFELRTVGRSEASELISKVTLSAILPSATVSPTLKQRFTRLARTELEREADRLHREARPQYMAGLFLHRTGEASAAIPYLERAHALSPRMPAILVALAYARLQVGQTEEALHAARAASELNPSVAESWFVYAQMTILSRDLDAAAALLRARARGRPPILLDDRVVAAYLAIDRTDHLLALWMEEASTNPNFEKRLGRYLRRRKERGWQPMPAR